MMQKLALFFLVLFTAQFASAQQNLSLEDCIQYALTNNPNLKTAQLQIADADWRVKENLATGLPQITAGITYTGFLQRAGIPASALGFPGAGDEKVVFSAVHSLAGELKVTQLIFNNSYLIGLRAAKYYRQYVENQLATTRYTLRNQVTDAYLPALLISENLATLDKNISNLDKLLSDTRAITKAGFAEQLDVDRLDLSLSSLRSERGNLVRQQEIVVNALKFAMGMPVGESISLSDNVEKLMSKYADADLTTQLNPMNRPEYLTLLKGRDLNAIQVELYEKPWMPTIAAFAQYSPGYQAGFGAKGGDNFDKWFFIPSAVAGLSISIPIWDGGGSKAKKNRAMIALQTVDVQKQLLENAFNLELETARKQYQNATERAANQQKNLDLAQRIYDTTQTKYKAGVGSSFEVTQAEQGLYAAQQSLMTARYDLLAARVSIKKALGQQ
jgi:outer membrane protein TolC